MLFTAKNSTMLLTCQLPMRPSRNMLPPPLEPAATMYFRGIGTATPVHRFTKTECLEAFQQAAGTVEADAPTRDPARQRPASGTLEHVGLATRHAPQMWKGSRPEEPRTSAP